MTEEQKKPEEQPKEAGDKNAIAVFSYLGIFLIIPLLVAKEDPFVKFHVKQGLVLLIASILVFVISLIPIIGWLFGILAIPAMLIFSIIGIVNVLGGEKKELPLIGQYASKFDF